ncbi:MAG: cardiolipin synthase [Prevotella sp.]|nr:cardiolipin synthase [Prevotella sp.]
MIYIHWIILLVYATVVIASAIAVMMDNRQPAKTLAWLLVLIFVPVAGIILYFFFGQNTRRERFIEKQSLDRIAKRTMLGFVEQRNLNVPPEHRHLVRMFSHDGWALPFKNNEVEIYTDGYQYFPALLHDISMAREHIHIDVYIFEDDALGNLVADALIERALAGVEVRVIYDSVGCWSVPSSFFERMRDAGIDVHAFMPVKFPAFTSKVNYRNHRKLTIIDGTVGYIGGMNIALRYVKGTKHQPWYDTHLKVRGGAVYGIQAAFLADWYFVDRTLINDRRYYPELPSIDNDCLAQVVTSNPTSPFPEIMHGYVRVLLEAREYVYLMTPYYMPTEQVVMAMHACALSGVDVRLIIPMHVDAKVVEWASRSYVMQSAADGVKIFLYDKGFNHSKVLICDDKLCSCGSANVDFRSFEHNFESNIFIYDSDVTLRMKQVFLDYQEQSVPLEQLKDLEHRSFFSRLWESFVRLFSPLL